MTTFRILDLDNCISNDGWRIKYIDWSIPAPERYHVYHLLAQADELGNESLCRDGDMLNIIFTGREERNRALTLWWLHKHNILHGKVRMRENGDTRPSVQVKLDMLHDLLEKVPLNQIACAYDDHPQIIDMYRAHGIHNARRVWLHEISAYRDKEAI